MDPQQLEQAKGAGRAALMYAAGAAGAYFIIDLLSKIPVIGLLFFCVNFFLVLGAYFGIAYYITPRLAMPPSGPSKGMAALWPSIGVAVVTTACLLVAVLIAGIIGVAVGSALGGSDSAFGSAVTGTLGLVITLVVFAIVGLIVGTGLSFLGTYVALGRNQNIQPAAPPY
ncbi:MAG TPA: hypothetical protein VFW96_21365 [Thermomicrobiales bacterium]|nr:hypothetical protein [Thermomicrobiales bacterium]